MDPRIVERGFGFVTYPSAVLKGDVYNKKKKKYAWGSINHLLFGDYVKIYKDENGLPIKRTVNRKVFYKVKCRDDGYLLSDDVEFDRILEVNFVDVAQGDGCHVVTPDDEHFVVDAGKSDNMYRFLAWRFNIKKYGTFSKPMTAVITHPDDDHYGGFNKLFGTKSKSGESVFSWKKVFHNGLVESSGSKVETLGNIVTKDGVDFVNELIFTEAQFKRRTDSVSKPGNYIKYMNKVSADRVGLKLGSPPIYARGNTSIEVLGPVTTKVANRHALPIFNDEKGQTKNGHSVVLKLNVGKLKVLFGGDLNAASEHYLFKHYADTDITALNELIDAKDTSKADKAKAVKKIDLAISKMNEYFGVDIAKSCHHGSGDFTSEFLRAINPIATVISSGDNESHCHPRPETLGSIGKHSRGSRSLIFSTELSRSSKEFVERKMFGPKQNKLRTVTVYGMIVVRTDGERTVIATKLEKPRGNSSKWQIYRLEFDSSIDSVVWLDESKH